MLVQLYQIGMIMYFIANYVHHIQYDGIRWAEDWKHGM